MFCLVDKASGNNSNLGVDDFKVILVPRPNMYYLTFKIMTYE